MALDVVAQQQDFSYGAFQAGARKPAGSAEAIRGLLGDDGLPYRRGGSTYKSNAALGSAGLGWVWAGSLAGGVRTLFQSMETDARLAVLGADDLTPVVLRTDVGYPLPGPFRPAVVAGMAVVLLQGGATFYAGSRKTGGAQVYNTGTVDVTNGSAAVVGHGTAWLANVDAGMLFDRAGITPAAVLSVESDTALTLARPYPGVTAAGSGYTLGTWFQRPPSTLSKIWTAVANRWVVGAGRQINWSDVLDMNTWVATNNHQFPYPVVGLGTLRDVVLVFTQGGLWAVSGLQYELVDPATGEVQHRRELVNQDLIAWGHEGIASWSGALVVPCLDDVYAVDSLGAPTPIGGRIRDLYLGYVRAGYKPGVAEVFDGHYLLPVLTAGNVWVDTLVCRLRATNSGVSFGWSQLAGQGAEVTGFAERPSGVLLGSSARAGSRVLSVASYFSPAVGVKADADGSAHSFQLTTVDYPTGNMVSNFVHHVRLVYALTDAGDVPSVAGEVSVDGGAWAALTGLGAATAGSVAWRVNRHAKNVRFRFTVAAAAADMKVKSVEVFVRRSGRQ